MVNRAGRSKPGLLQEFALLIVAVIAGAVGVVSLGATLRDAIRLGSARSLQVRDMDIANASSPEFTESIEGLDARYSGVTLEIVDPPGALLRADFWSAALGASIVVVLCGLLVWLCVSTLRGRPFAHGMASAFVITGATVAAADVGSDLMRFRVKRLVVELYGHSAGDAGQGPYEGFASGMNFMLSFTGAGIFLCVLGVAFALGNRMQRDTERLV